ncbi:thiamine pyrophosphate-binding protein [Ferdinandcohnia quinoae]|uniref:Thiamine pyrophosphate-binding protein n=1 Tax=Fredinandcohnia quinoae TaxID=2918902 RepID=A0AAW5EAX2_9BACI|nr:thiamine pyrophosphate-binding protein [Fredinandcohnia sp. SECRCQ15]MCH1625914.1 thiamine pyrophosphate-binding protein [Fredinandcohnia sp. SECRCQ15]
MTQFNETVARLLLKQLELWGVKRIYGVVGDAIIGLMDELAKQNAIQFIAVKHESVAAMMASAEAKLTGKLGVCLVTMGPGLGNLMNGLGDAYLDKAPVLAITGQAPTNKIGTDYKQYIDQQELIKPMAEYTTLLTNPDAIIDVLVKAMHTSLEKGSVTHLSIPKDLFELPSTGKLQSKATIIQGNATAFNEHDIEQVLSIMKSAKRPMILAGLGAKNAVNEVEALAKIWGAGILVSLGAKGYFRNSSDNLLGGIGQGGNPHAKQLFQQADVVLLIGNLWWPEGYVPQQARIIQIDITKENIGKGIQVELGICGMADAVTPLLTESLGKHEPNQEWIAQFKEVKQKWDLQNEQEGLQPNEPLHPSRIMRAIENQVETDAIIGLDTGDVTVWFNRNFRSQGQTILFSGEWRTMGFGLPAALAAKLCNPEKQVIAIVGDGGIQMTLADLLTAIRYQLNITVIILNNHALQMERDKMIVSGNIQNGVDLTNPDFVKIAEACTWKGYNIKNISELEPTLAEALSKESPTLVSIETAPIVHPETK